MRPPPTSQGSSRAGCSSCSRPGGTGAPGGAAAPGAPSRRRGQPGLAGGAISQLNGVSSKGQSATRGRPGVGVRSSSLLRLRPATPGLALLLAITLAGAGATVAQAAGQAPDPSPSLSAPGPDPYPAPSAPRAAPRPAASQAPSVVRTRVVPAPAHRSPDAPRKAQPAAARGAVAKPVRLPVRPAPGLGARVATALAVEPQPRVPRTLALAVALVVLLSAAFVAGAAREVAR